MHPKRYVPWYAKIAAKVVLARLPVPHGVWHRVGLFQHGLMDDPDYAVEVFEHHRRLLGGDVAGRTVLELGPGDSLATAVIACAMGAQRTVLVDVAPFATADVAFYRVLAQRLAGRGLPAPDLDGATTLADVLQRSRGEYLVDGLASLRAIPDGSVDHVISQAVVEHIPLDEVEPTFREIARLLAPGGSSSHTVDLRDHLDEALNSLRFAASRWESPLFARSGFYTNRLRFSELLEVFERCGFDVSVTAVTRWDTLPTPRERLQPHFQRLADDDLRVRTFDCILRGSSS